MNSKSKVWALALLAGVLLLGGVAGAAADRLFASEAGCPDAESTRHGRAGDERTSYLDWLAAELDLTEEQHARAQNTVERHREQMSGLWREVRPRFEEMKAELRGEIRNLLSEEQRTRYEELLKNQPRRWYHGKRRSR